MNEVLRTVRTRPDGGRSEAVLAAENGRYVLSSSDGTRELPGPDLAAALRAAPELTVIDAATRIEITCADLDVRSALLDALHDDDPTAGFDESAWPQDTDDLPETEEYAVDEVLAHRWLTIDGGTYHLLPMQHRTRVVLVEDGEIASGIEVASASWSFDGDITSSTGSESLRVVGGDTLVRQNLGDDLPETQVEPFAGDVVAVVVRWLEDNAYTPAYLLRTLPAPGLTADERTTLDQHGHQTVTVYIDTDIVLDRLCAARDRNEFRRALADPASPGGERTYALLRAIIADEKPVDDLLGTLV